MTPNLGRLALGAVAGTLATAPMTAVMEAAWRWLPPDERYPLPPREILEELAEKADAPLPDHESERVALALAAHFGYGAACGVGYALVQPRALPAALGAGVSFGVGVWAASYLGWLPAMHVLRPATEHPERRNALMIGAHVVWGAATAMLLHGLAGRGRRRRWSR